MSSGAPSVRQRAASARADHQVRKSASGTEMYSANADADPAVEMLAQPRASRSCTKAMLREIRSSNLFRVCEDEEPRQVVAGVGLLACLIVAAATQWPSAADVRPGGAFRKVIWSLLVFLVFYCVLNTRDGVMRRPHPALWRVLHGWNLWYCMICVALLVVPAEDGNKMMTWLFPDGRQKIEKIGFDHLACVVSYDNVKRQLFGLWFLAHCLGWWAKMVMLRDLTTCIVYSTFFELTELTLQFLVPEFQECWWDSLFMDWLVSNLLIGMNLGRLTLWLLKTPWFNWSAVAKPASWYSRTALLLTPSTWSEYEWNPSNDPVTLVLNAVIWLIMAVGEVNSFFLINILELPRDHIFNCLRQGLLCLTALPAVEEWYEYTRHSRAHQLGKEWFEYTTQYKGRKPRIGHFTWLLSVTVGVETAAVVKYSVSLGLLSKATPGAEIYVPWLGSAVLFSAYFASHFWFFYYRKGSALPNWVLLLKWVSWLPLLGLCRLYAF